MTLSEQIASLRDLAIQALETEAIAERVDMDADADADGFSTEEPCIVLAYSIEKTAKPWQAMVAYEGSGMIPLCAGDNEATPEEAVASLRDALTPEAEWVRP